MAGGAWWGVCVAGRCMPWQIPWDTVNERAVRILLECILVLIFIQSIECGHDVLKTMWLSTKIENAQNGQ